MDKRRLTGSKLVSLFVFCNNAPIDSVFLWATLKQIMDKVGKRQRKIPEEEVELEIHSSFRDEG